MLIFLCFMFFLCRNQAEKRRTLSWMPRVSIAFCLIYSNRISVASFLKEHFVCMTCVLCFESVLKQLRFPGYQKSENEKKGKKMSLKTNCFVDDKKRIEKHWKSLVSFCCFVSVFETFNLKSNKRDNNNVLNEFDKMIWEEVLDTDVD